MRNKISAFLMLALIVFGAAGVSSLFTSQAYAAAAKEAVVDDDGMRFVRLDPLTLPIIDGDGVSQMVSLVIVLEVDDLDKVSKIKKYTPKLKDAYIQNMYGILNRKATIENGVLKVSSIKNKISKVTHEVMGEGYVNAVLLETVQQRPI